MDTQVAKVDFTEKVGRIRDLAAANQLEGILVTSQANFTWLSGGRSFIGLASEASCAAFLITQSSVYMLVSNIEASRLSNEEFPDISNEIDIRTFPWFHPGERDRLIRELLDGGSWKSDLDLKGDFLRLRTCLTTLEIERFRWLGREAARAVERVCRSLKPGVSEFEAAGEVSKSLWDMEIEPVTLLIAFNDRIIAYRYPLPTSDSLKRQAMIAVCAREWGLFVSHTRLVHFGALPADLAAKHSAVANIDAEMIAATRPGTQIGEIIATAVRAYEKYGYTDEWRLHHQGGLTAYAARELLGNSESSAAVEAN